MDTIQRPQWIDDVAKKVHKWRNNPAIFERFCKQILAYFTEADTGDDEASRLFQQSSTEDGKSLLEDRPYLLGEKYLILFLLHDVVYPQGKAIDPFLKDRFADPYELVEPCATYPYAIEVENIKSYPPNDKTRIESFLDDVEKDLQDIIGRESGDIDNVMATKIAARPSEEDETLFRDIARDIKANPDDYKDAGKWLDKNFGIATKRTWQQKVENPLLRSYEKALTYTIDPPTAEIDAVAQLRPLISRKTAHRILLLTWLLTDTDDLNIPSLKLTLFQGLPYEPNDDIVFHPEDYLKDEEYDSLAYRERLKHFVSRRCLYRNLLGDHSVYDKLLTSTRRAWNTLFSQKNTTAEQPPIPVAGQTQQSGGDVSWQGVQKQLLKKRSNGTPYTKQSDLAKELGCSVATINKAINKSDTLKGWKAREASSSPRTRSLNKVDTDRISSQRESNPVQNAEENEANDAILNRLLQEHEGKPEVRGWLNRLSGDRKKEAVAILKNDPDSLRELIDNDL